MVGWDDYRFFLTVVRTGSHSAAARALGVSQPTVSRRIEQLEEALGLRVVMRGPTGCVPTEAGQEILRFVEGIEREAVAIDRAMARHRSGGGSPVRLATTRGLAVWLAPRLRDLPAELRARLQILIGLHRADLAHAQADLALRMGRPGDDELRGRKLCRVHSGLYASRRYLEMQGTPTQWEDVAGHPGIRSVEGIAALPQVQVLDGAVEMQGGPGANCVAVQIALAKEGLGLTPVPCFMAAEEASLVRVMREQFDVPVDLWA
ncbi:MAG: LysR family transcriptional regulator, partial [Myxococcota bacterium]